MNIKAIYLCLINMLVCCYCSYAQNLNANEKTPRSGEYIKKLKLFDDTIDSILVRTKIPGASLAVSYKERLVYDRGHGFAQLNDQDTIPLTENSVFRIASISKPITAVAIMYLIEQQKLELGSKVYDILKMELPREEVIDPQIYDITIKDILSHTGGWNRNISGDPAFNVLRMSVAMGDDPPGNDLAVIKYMFRLPLDFKPGSEQVYSNFGYMILGRVIEKITGQDYEKFIQNEILKPNKINTMMLGRILLKDRQKNEVFYHDSRTFPSVVSGGGIVPAPYGAFNLKAMKAHGGWISSASDLLRFLTSVNGLSLRKDILPAQSIREMTNPYGSFENNHSRYGMGWEIAMIDNQPIWFHRGDLPGTTAFLVHSGDVEFAVLLNGNAGSRENSEYILSALVKAANSISDWPEIDLFYDN